MRPAPAGGFRVGEQVWVYTGHGWRVGLVLEVAREEYRVQFPLARPFWVEASRCHPAKERGAA